MNWTMIGAVGELVGALAVVLSLLYVARQLRASTRRATVEAYHSVLSEMNSFATLLAEDPELADIWWRSTGGLSELNDIERVRFHSMLFVLFRSWEKAFQYHQSGGLEDWSAEGINQTIGDFAAYRGVQDYWALRKHWFTPEFRRWVDETISAGKGREIYGEAWKELG